MTMRSADTELQNTLELRAKAPLEIAAPKPDLDAKGKKHYVEALFKRNIKENHQRQIWENLVTNHYRNLHAAIPIRFTMSSCKRQWYYARSHSAKQPWRSHYNAFSSITWLTRISLRTWLHNMKKTSSHYTATCNQRVNKRIESCAQEPPLIAEHRRGTDRDWNDRSRTRRTQKVASIACRSHLIQKNTRLRSAAFPPTQAPCNIRAAITLQSATRESTNE